MAGADSLYLLLARSGSHVPVLPDGLSLPPAVAPVPAAAGPFGPPAAAAPTRSLPGAPGDPSAGDEPEQDDVPIPPPAPLWGVIAPEGAVGDRLLAVCDRLIKARQAKQELPVPVYRVPKPSGPMSLSDALAWRETVYDAGADLGYGRAQFQLVLGDLGDVPLAIQKVQEMDGKVGRLFFADEKGYEAYIDKLLRAEQAPRRGLGRVVMHTAHDGSAALDLGLTGLSQPGEALLRAAIAAGKLPASGITAYAQPWKPGKDVLLDHAAGGDPGVLFTMSHGLGLPVGGWASAAAQRAGQGAMAFGVDDMLTGDDLGTRSFMPGGLWLMFACFGAGTPDASVYQHWLDQLTAAGHAPPDLGRTLAIGAPFVAELPQKALANPAGPLAFVGHVDLAWTHCFRDEDDPGQSRAGRFMRVLGSALAGDPFGVAFQHLTTFVLETDAALTHAYADDVPAPSASTPPSAAALAAQARARALLWMRRQDLDGFVLLGDPLGRLAVGPPPTAQSFQPDDRLAVGGMPLTMAAIPPPPPDPTGSGTAAPAPDAMEKAILETLLGQRTVAEIAAAYHVDPGELSRRAEASREAGRRTIG